MNAFHLDVQQIGEVCYFQLRWGQGQQLAAQVPSPVEVYQCYETWQQAYLRFYQDFRARPGFSGTGVLPKVDWRSRLVQAEAALLHAFDTWLSQTTLLPLRTTLLSAIVRLNASGAQPASRSAPAPVAIDLFLTCGTAALERLPWETWELGKEFPLPNRLRLTRAPANIRLPSQTAHPRRRIRMLAIMGDETGLDFQAEQAALKRLQRVAEVKFVGYQGRPENASTVPDTQQLRATIRQAIADERGWDLLFFAGHSNETALTGGELGIAPGETLAIEEIAADLTDATKRGLQFALFNSCQGLSIAQALIDLGLSQVAIMREPIHNQVAQQFFLQFVHHLTQGQDVHEAVLAACDHLKCDRNLTYPSSYWIPSLFRHPGATLFKLPTQAWQRWQQQWAPTGWEAGVLASLTVLSLLAPVQSGLLDRRLWVQSLYRYVTGQVPQNDPPVRLIAIDKVSLDQAKLQQRNPLPWGYLAQVLNRLAPYHPQTVGIDYLLDDPARQNPQDVTQVKQAIQSILQQPQVQLVFSSVLENGKTIGVHPDLGIAQRPRVSQGCTYATDWWLPLPASSENCSANQPFTYLLAIASSQVQTNPSQLAVLHKTQALPITQFSHQLGQFWLQPIFDFSIPPDRVYTKLSAHQLWSANGMAQAQQLPQQVILIAAGDYAQAGIDDQTKDYTDNPPQAMRFWTPPDQPAIKIFTWGELNAYAIHHFIYHHFIIPLPDLWLVWLAGLVGKRLTQERRRWKLPLWIGGSTLYGALSLQLYVSGSLLLPIVFPVAVVGFYLFPLGRRTE
jgi:hypothetical protein